MTRDPEAVEIQARAAPQALIREAAAIVGKPDLRALVLATSKDPNPKVTAVLFSPGAELPICAVKLPTTDVAEEAVERERRLLTMLHRFDLGPLHQTVPRVLSSIEVRGRKGLLMSAVPGSSMLSTYHRWHHTAKPVLVRADFEAASEWLTSFQRRTASESGSVELACSLARVLHLRFPDYPTMEAVSWRLADIQARLSQANALRSAVHGDFWVGNVLARQRWISGVVDWETGSALGDPVRDFVRFALTYALYLDRRTGAGREVRGHPGLRAGVWGAGVVYAFEGEGWFPDLFRQFLQNELQRRGIPPELWRSAALAGLAEIAATADHEGFAKRHLELFTRLAPIG